MFRKIIGILLALALLTSCSVLFSSRGGEMAPTRPTEPYVGDLLLVNPRPYSPDHIHLGVWYWINNRIYETVPHNYTDILWSVADSIKSSEGWLAYGATIWGPPLRIVLEKGYEHNPYIICHEFVHVITWSADEDSEAMYTCSELLNTDLPGRWWREPTPPIDPPA